MTRLNRLLTCAVAGALVATASCRGDGSSPVETEPDTEDFNLLTGCSGTCVAGFLAMIDDIRANVSCAEAQSAGGSMNLRKPGKSQSGRSASSSCRAV